jgi:hypothetical protein
MLRMAPQDEGGVYGFPGNDVDPTGKSPDDLSSPSCKNILLFRNGKSL